MNTSVAVLTGVVVAVVIGGAVGSARLANQAADADAHLKLAEAVAQQAGGNPTLDRCRSLLEACKKAIADLKGCSKFMHVITLGNWCNDEAINAVATCRAAREVCEAAATPQ
jgi:hypothetical protein